MSWKASAWAKECRVGGPGPKALLLCLADYADPETQECYPGQEQLAADSEQSVRTVRRQLADLEALGAITRSKRYRENGNRTSDRYVCHIEQLIDAESTTGQIGRKDGTTGQIEATTGQTRGGLPATGGRGITRESLDPEPARASNQTEPDTASRRHGYGGRPFPDLPHCRICNTRHGLGGCPGDKGNLSGLDAARAALEAS